MIETSMDQVGLFNLKIFLGGTEDYDTPINATVVFTFKPAFVG